MCFSKQTARGSITLVALSLAVVIGVSLGSYIALCYQAQQLSTRTIQLSRARQLAESSMEEALWALNNNWTSAPWTAPTANDRELVITDLPWGEGVTGVTTIRVTNINSPNPIIISTSAITVPRLGVFSRTLKATTKPAPLFANAIGIVDPRTNPTVASGTYAVKFNNGGLVDSWDSDYLGNAPLGPLPAAAPNRDYISTTPYPGTSPVTSPVTVLPSPYLTASPTSTYPTASFNYAAVVAAPNITLNNAEIRGYANTFGNPITTTAGGKISAPPPPGTPPAPPPIDPTRVGKSAFVPKLVVDTPTGAPFGTIDGSTDTTIDNSSGSVPRIIDASATDLTLNGTSVTIKGHVIIRVMGNLDLIFGGKIIVHKPPSPGPETGRLEIFSGGSIRIGGATSSVAGFVNDTDEPKRLALYSTSTSPSRTFQYYSTLPFCGVIYSAAPSNAKIDFQATNPEIFGAILANSNIEFAGTPKFHYDTALQYLPKGWFKGVTTPFIIVQVTEL